MAVIHWWKLTTNANDSISTLHLTNNGGVTFDPTTGASFNTANALTTTYSIPAICTLSAWIKPADFTHSWGQIIGGQMVSDGTAFTSIVANGSTGELQYAANSQYTALASEYVVKNYPSSSFTLVVLSIGATLTFYRNNTSVSTKSITTGYSGNSFCIGYEYRNVWGFSGNIIDVKIHNNTFTAADTNILWSEGPNGIWAGKSQILTGGM